MKTINDYIKCYHIDDYIIEKANFIAKKHVEPTSIKLYKGVSVVSHDDRFKGDNPDWNNLIFFGVPKNSSVMNYDEDELNQMGFRVIKHSGSSASAVLSDIVSCGYDIYNIDEYIKSDVIPFIKEYDKHCKDLVIFIPKKNHYQYIPVALYKDSKIITLSDKLINEMPDKTKKTFFNR